MNADLPPGQRALNEFPRFGLFKYARRFPDDTDSINLDIGGDVTRPVKKSTGLTQLGRVSQVSDFHCVTTWTRRGVSWSGFRFSDFYESIVLPEVKPETGANFVVFRCQDGYKVSMQLNDLLADNVILADKLDGQPLPVEHGAPLRLIAPDHYGYKSPKHVKAIEFWRDDRNYRPAAFSFMDHPRARVMFEERGRVIPGKLLRWLYRPLIGPTRRRFKSALLNYRPGRDPRKHR